MSLRLWLLVLVIRLRLILLHLLKLHGVLQLHTLIALILELDLDWLRLARVILLLLGRLNVRGIESVDLDISGNALSNLLLVLLLRLAHDHCLVLDLALVVRDLHRLGLVYHVYLLLELKDLLFRRVKFRLLCDRSLLFLLILLIVRLALRLSLC